MGREQQPRSALWDTQVTVMGSEDGIMLMGCIKHQPLEDLAHELYILASTPSTRDTKRTLKRNFYHRRLAERPRSSLCKRITPPPSPRGPPLFGDNLATIQVESGVRSAHLVSEEDAVRMRGLWFQGPGETRGSGRR